MRLLSTLGVLVSMLVAGGCSDKGKGLGGVDSGLQGTGGGMGGTLATPDGPVEPVGAGGTGGGVVGSGGSAAGTGGVGTVAIGTGGRAGGSSGGTGGVGSGTGGATAASTGGSTGGCDKDLSGTWDLVATPTNFYGGGPGTGKVVLGADSLSVAIDDKRSGLPGTHRLSFTGASNPSLVWERANDPAVSIATTNSPAALDAGSLPLQLGGLWAFSANQIRCSADVSAETTTFAFNRSNDAPLVGGRWPRGAVPTPRLGTVYTVTKTATSDSSFGFIGGQWQARSSTSAETCSMRAEGSTIQLNCQTGTVWRGLAQLTVGNDCVASGLTSTGVELSARRR